MVDLGTTHIWTTLHFRLNETKQMFLIHAAGMMNVGVNLSDIIKVAEEFVRQ